LKALKFYSSVRIRVSKKSGTEIKKKIGGGDEIVIGHSILCNIKKNKVNKVAGLFV